MCINGAFAIVVRWYPIAPTVLNFKGNVSIFLMHSGIVNGCQLLFDAHTLPEQHTGTAALFLFHSLSSFLAVSFCVSFCDILFLFLDASIYC